MNLEDSEIIPLLNALGEHNHLRTSILPSLLKNLSENQHHEYPQNLFEVGRVFSKGDSQTGIIEKESLAIVTCHDKTDFTQLRQILNVLTSSLGLECCVKESSHPSYINGRFGEIYIKEQKVGLIGEFHPVVLENWQLPVPSVGMELNIEKIFELVK